MADSISLDELIALNDEIAALVRAGVPLDSGLAGWGRDLPGKLGRISAQVGQSIAQGKTLPQSLADPSAPFPPVYRALVTAGMRSGRLPAALESLATSARNLREVRRAVALAVVYPLVLVVLGYFVLWILLAEILPTMLILYDGRPPRFWAGLAECGQWFNYPLSIPGTDRYFWAGWIPPAVLLAGVTILWLLSSRAALLGGGSRGRWEWIPLAGRVVRHGRLASMAEIVGLLVAHDVPLGEALVLAADCTADRRLMRAARELAVSLEQGGSPPAAERMAEFPPLLAWLVSSGGRRDSFVAVAHHVADTYRRRIARESRWLRDILPIWLVVVIGGGIALVAALTVYLPFTELMQRLAESMGGSMRIRP